jgi:hypothetical protein
MPGPKIAVEALRPGGGELRFFSGRELPLTLRVHGAQGQRLELEVRAVQLAHALAVPVGPAVSVASGVELGERAWHEFPLKLATPALESAVTWELRFLARTEGEPWQPAGTTRLELHPPDLLAPLRAHARARGWFVSDRPGALKAFLNAAAIPFSDLDQPSAREALERCRATRGGSDRPLVLCVRDPGIAELQPGTSAAGAGTLVFEDLPAHALRWEPERSLVALDRGVIARLPDDPHAQIALVEAVALTQRPPGTDEREDIR